jgi:UPF0176 protein
MKIIVSSFYKYVKINNLEEFQKQHLDFCNKLGIKGKILIAEEGINGSVSGTKEQTEKYKEELKKNKLFNNIKFKDNLSEAHPFRKTIVRIRKEIVTSGLKVNLENKGAYISPKELNKLIAKNKDVILVDARNNYESKIGKFRNAIAPDIELFREFKNIKTCLEKFKDKKIVTYCTGGVRCEKASALLRENGFNNVFQLEGGILNYINQFPDKHFEGRCFVFDNRISIPSGSKNNEISFCELCHVPSGRYINCRNVNCDKMFLCCEECSNYMEGACSKKCRAKAFN